MGFFSTALKALKVIVSIPSASQQFPELLQKQLQKYASTSKNALLGKGIEGLDSDGAPIYRNPESKKKLSSLNDQIKSEVARMNNEQIMEVDENTRILIKDSRKGHERILNTLDSLSKNVEDSTLILGSKLDDIASEVYKGFSQVQQLLIDGFDTSNTKVDGLEGEGAESEGFLVKAVDITSAILTAFGYSPDAIFKSILEGSIEGIINFIPKIPKLIGKTGKFLFTNPWGIGLTLAAAAVYTGYKVNKAIQEDYQKRVEEQKVSNDSVQRGNTVNYYQSLGVNNDVYKATNAIIQGKNKKVNLGTILGSEKIESINGRTEELGENDPLRGKLSSPNLTKEQIEQFCQDYLKFISLNVKMTERSYLRIFPYVIPNSSPFSIKNRGYLKRYTLQITGNQTYESCSKLFSTFQFTDKDIFDYILYLVWQNCEDKKILGGRGDRNGSYIELGAKLKSDASKNIKADPLMKLLLSLLDKLNTQPLQTVVEEIEKVDISNFHLDEAVAKNLEKNISQFDLMSENIKGLKDKDTGELNNKLQTLYSQRAKMAQEASDTEFAYDFFGSQRYKENLEESAKIEEEIKIAIEYNKILNQVKKVINEAEPIYKLYKEGEEKGWTIEDIISHYNVMLSYQESFNRIRFNKEFDKNGKDGYDINNQKFKNSISEGWILLNCLTTRMKENWFEKAKKWLSNLFSSNDFSVSGEGYTELSKVSSDHDFEFSLHLMDDQKHNSSRRNNELAELVEKAVVEVYKNAKLPGTVYTAESWNLAESVFWVPLYKLYIDHAIKLLKNTVHLKYFLIAAGLVTEPLLEAKANYVNEEGLNVGSSIVDKNGNYNKNGVQKINDYLNNTDMLNGSNEFIADSQGFYGINFVAWSCYVLYNLTKDYKMFENSDPTDQKLDGLNAMEIMIIRILLKSEYLLNKYEDKTFKNFHILSKAFLGVAGTEDGKESFYKTLSSEEIDTWYYGAESLRKKRTSPISNPSSSENVNVDNNQPSGSSVVDASTLESSKSSPSYSSYKSSIDRNTTDWNSTYKKLQSTFYSNPSLTKEDLAILADLIVKSGEGSMDATSLSSMVITEGLRELALKIDNLSLSNTDNAGENIDKTVKTGDGD